MTSKESSELSNPLYGADILTERYFKGTPCKVDQQPGRGRFIVATETIEAGTIVLDALPYAFSVDAELKSLACSHCLKTSVETFRSINTGSIASVDAVLINECLESGGTVDDVQDLVDKLAAAKNYNIEDDIPLGDALEVAENSMPPEPPTEPIPLQTWHIGCGICQQVFYCSEECQDADKILHQLQCAGLVKLRHQSWASSDLTMARIIIHIMARKQLESQNKPTALNYWNTKFPVSAHSERLFNEFNFQFDISALVSNESQIMARVLANRRPLVKFLQRLYNFQNAEEPVRLIGKVDENTFGIRLDRNLSYAFGVFPSMSYFNHSCSPNVCVIQRNTSLYIVAMRKIDRDEEIAISYIEVNRTTSDRRKCLQYEYNFYCRCPRCNAPTSNSTDDFVKQFVCPNSHCDGKGLLAPTKQDECATKACNICQSQLIIKR